MNKFSFCRSEKNLPLTKESWRSADFKERRDSIIRHYQATCGTLPTKNLKPIREMVIDILDRNTLADVQALVRHIKELYHIDCFQISIDRSKKVCRLLFDFYNAKGGCCYHLSPNEKLQVGVLVVKHLSLPVPAILKPTWTYYSVKYELETNHRLVEEVLEECKEKGFSKAHYQLIRDCMKLARNTFASYRRSTK